MVSAGDAPTGGGAEVFVGFAVAIHIAQLGDLGTLGGIQRAVMPGEAEDLVQAAGEEFEVGLGGVGGILRDPHFAFAQAHGELAIRQHGDAAGLEVHAFRELVGFGLVVGGLVLGECRGAQSEREKHGGKVGRSLRERRRRPLGSVLTACLPARRKAPGGGLGTSRPTCAAGVCVPGVVYLDQRYHDKISFVCFPLLLITRSKPPLTGRRVSSTCTPSWR